MSIWQGKDERQAHHPYHLVAFPDVKKREGKVKEIFAVKTFVDSWRMGWAAEWFSPGIVWGCALPVWLRSVKSGMEQHRRRQSAYHLDAVTLCYQALGSSLLCSPFPQDCGGR